MKLHPIPLTLLCCCALHAPAAPVELTNPELTVVVQPEHGGKISAMRHTSGGGFTLTPAQIADPAAGLAKERVYGDALEYAAAPYKILKQSPRSITLQCAPLPERPQLEITKTISLPENGRHVKVDVTYRNTAPLAGAFQIIPWVHHSFVPAGSADRFLTPHTTGVSETRPEKNIIVQNIQEAGGNWSLYRNAAENRALLFASPQKPRVIYNFVAPKLSTVEFLYDAVDPIPAAGYSYVLSLSEAASDMPLALTPALPGMAATTPGTQANLDELFRNATEADQPVNVRFWKNRAYLSPDLIMPLVFGIRNLTGNSALEFEIDLPHSLALEKAVGDYWRMAGEAMTPIAQTELETASGKITRHRFKVEARQSADWLHSHCRLLMRAKAEAGEFVLPYRIFQDGREVASGSVPGEIIRIPRAATPKHFKLLMGIDYALYRAWPDADESLRHLGVNGLCFNENVPNSVVSADDVRALNRELAAKGFMTATMGVFFSPPGELSRNYPADLMALDRNGKPARAFDFTARGPWMEATVDQAVRRLTLGYDLAISDYEAFFGGSRISFTTRTIDAFRKWLGEQPGAPAWIDPKLFTAEPEKYPQLNRLWVEFKCAMFLDYLKSVIEPARKRAPETRIGWCTIPGASDESIKADHLTDSVGFTRLLDVNAPMLYDNLYRTMHEYRATLKRFRQFVDQAGNGAKLMPTLSAGFWGEPNRFPPEHTFYILLKTALAQCDGAYLFPGFAGSDNENLRQIAAALDLIARLEPMLTQAVRADGIATVTRAENTALKLPAAVEPLVLTKDSRALVYLAEYSAHPITLAVRFTLPGPCRLREWDGAELGTVNNGDTRSFELKPGAKGLLLQLERTDNTDFPVDFKGATAKSEGAKTSANLIFQDSFDGTTKGRNAVAGHNFSFDDGGFEGKCLYFRDYESAWVLPESLKVASGDVTVEFRYKAPGNFAPGGSMNRDLVRGELDEQRVFWLFFDAGSGKLRLAIGKNNPGKQTDWYQLGNSETERWAGGIWQKIRLSLGKSGIRLEVDGKTEYEGPVIGPVREVSNLQLGRRWVSLGRFDELQLLDETAAKK